jgi:hypothetical protein
MKRYRFPVIAMVQTLAFALVAALVAALAVGGAPATAATKSTSSKSTKAKTSKSKKTKKPKVKVTLPNSAAAPAAGAAAGAGGGRAARSFSCVGSPTLQLQVRTVTGTVDAKFNLTNVSVTQTYQRVGDAIVEQPTVVLTVANPIGKLDPGATPLIVYRLNELAPVTAADVDKVISIYQFNLPTVLPPGPTFEAGLYFKSFVGTAGPLAGELRWSTVASQAAGGAYGMKCQYT